LSDVTVDEFKALKKGIDEGSVHPRDAKVDFAKEIVKRFHGTLASADAHANFDKVFKNKEIPDDIEVVRIKREEIDSWLPKLLVKIAMVPSTTEGKRIIAQGGVSINGSKAAGEEISVEGVDELVVKVGKRKFKKLILY
jgi:tyrosyl-tRNA synthetase